MVSTLILFTASLIACGFSTQMTFFCVRLAGRPLGIVGQFSQRSRRLGLRYAAGSFAILACVAFAGVCSALIQVFTAAV